MTRHLNPSCLFIELLVQLMRYLYSQCFRGTTAPGDRDRDTLGLGLVGKLAFYSASVLKMIGYRLPGAKTYSKYDLYPNRKVSRTSFLQIFFTLIPFLLYTI